MDPVISKSISKLTTLVTHVVKTTANFKPELRRLVGTLDKIDLIIKDVVKYNHILDRPRKQSQMFIIEIKDAQELVKKCLEAKWYSYTRYTHSVELKKVNAKLLRFFQLEVQADQSLDIKQTLLVVNDTQQIVDHVSTKVDRIHEWVSLLVTEQMPHKFTEGRERLGWRVPPTLPQGIVGFDEPLKKLKAKVLADIDVCDDDFDEKPVVVVADGGGFGKTTLVTMLCHDPDIQGKFGENIFFVTVSETPNLMAIVNDLVNPNPSSQPIQFQSDEDAKHKLRNFLVEKVSASGPMLLVLDDVWSDSFIENFPLKIKGCRILVTSRTAFPQLIYDVFCFNPLSDKDAEILFRQSAFTKSKKRPLPSISEDLVTQMVKRCKKHPLTLKVVGRSLNGRDEYSWKSKLTTLSHGSLVLDSNKEVRNCLERSITTLDNELKECFMDFGLFPEDRRIPASALLDMWVHLYGHDNDGGFDTFDKIVELSIRNLLNLVGTSFRKDSGAAVNYCDQQFVTQHDLLRELAIDLSSKPEVPITQRKRLIINAQGEDLPASVMQPMQARILSISTGESFSSKWGDMKVPEAEVMVLNIKSKTYTLPLFMVEMQKLKILNVTNDGLFPTYIENFHLIACLSNLSRIRLERVVIHSLSSSILALENLQKVSFIMCTLGDAFKTELSSDSLKVWPGLVELEMDYCQDFVEFPGLLCNSVHLKTLSITNCNEMCEISDEFGKLTNLENISFRCCTKVKKLPGSITKLEKLSTLDISDCLSLCELPAEMGKLVELRTLYMKGCTEIEELPSSLHDLCDTNVLCGDELYYQWQEFDNVNTHLVEENRLETFYKII